MKDEYEILYLMGDLTYIYPFKILVLLLIPLILYIFSFYLKYKKIKFKLWAIVFLIILILPGLFSYIRFIDLKKHIDNNPTRVAMGKIENIDRFSGKDIIEFHNIYLSLSHQSLYCLSNRKLLSVNEDVIIEYYDLGININGDRSRRNICIVEVRRKK